MFKIDPRARVTPFRKRGRAERGRDGEEKKERNSD